MNLKNMKALFILRVPFFFKKCAVLIKNFIQYVILIYTYFYSIIYTVMSIFNERRKFICQTHLK